MRAMTQLHIVACFGLLSLLTGCAELTVNQYTFQGDPNRSNVAKLAIAKGIARTIQSKGTIWQPPTFEQRIGSVDVSPTGKDRKDTRGQIEMLRQALYEFAAEVEGKQGEVVGLDVRAEAKRIKDTLRFLSFDQIALEEEHWKNINPVSVSGWFGKSEFILVRDDGGNYNIKSASFDPSEVVAAGVNSAMTAIQLVGTAYGVPPMLSANRAAASSIGQGPKEETSVFNRQSVKGHISSQRGIVRDLESYSKQYRQDLEAVSGAIDTLNKEQLVASLRASTTTYQRALEAVSSNRKGLKGIAALFPEVEPVEKIAAQFGLASFGETQVVALYWAYRSGVSDDRELELVKHPLGGLIEFDGRNLKRKAGRDDAAILRELEKINKWGALRGAVTTMRETLAELDQAWGELVEVQSSYMKSFAIYQEAHQAIMDLERNHEDETKRKEALQALKKSIALSSASQFASMITTLEDGIAKVKKLARPDDVRRATDLRGELSPGIRELKRFADVFVGRAGLENLSQDDVKTLVNEVKALKLPTPITNPTNLSVPNGPSLAEVVGYLS